MTESAISGELSTDLRRSAAPQKRNPTLWVWLVFFGLAITYFVLYAPLLCSRGIWVNDEGNRILTVRALAERGTTALAEPADWNEAEYPGIRVYPAPYFVRDDSGQVRSGYTKYFAMLCSLAYRFGGLFAVRLLVLLCGVAVIALTGILARLIQNENEIRIPAMIFVGFGTTLLFYSGVILEIAVSTMMIAGACASLVSGIQQTERRHRIIRFVFGGLLAGASCWMREEGLVCGVALGASLLLIRECRKMLVPYGLAFVAAVVPLFTLNFLESGSVFGLHHEIYRAIADGAPTLPMRIVSFFFYVFRGNDPSTPGAIAVGGCLFVVVLGAAGSFCRCRRIGRILQDAALLILCVICALNYYGVLTRFDSGYLLLRSQSLAGWVPLALLPAIFAGNLWRGGVVFRYLLCVFLLSVCGIAGALDCRTAGMFVGPRHFTMILPIVCVLCAWLMMSIRQWRIRVAIGVVCLFSILFQVAGYRLLVERKAHSERLIQAVASAPEKVVGLSGFWLPEEFAGLRSDKRIFLMSGENGTDDLLRYAQEAAGGGPVLIVASCQYGMPLPRPKTLVSVVAGATIESELFRLLSVSVFCVTGDTTRGEY